MATVNAQPGACFARWCTVLTLWRLIASLGLLLMGGGSAGAAPAPPINPGPILLEPEIAVIPNPIDFGHVLRGRSVIRQDVRITNTGTKLLQITGQEYRPGPNSFVLVEPANVPSFAQVPPGQSISLRITFTAFALGPQSSSCVLTCNAPPGQYTITATGIGVLSNPTPPPAPPPTSGTAKISLNPESLGFGEQMVGDPGAARNITAANVGTAPILITGVSLTGANPGDFQITSPTGGSHLAEGFTRAIAIRFAPTAAGPRSATLVINDNAGGPHQVPLLGVGKAPPGGTSPAADDWPVFGQSPGQRGVATAGLDPLGLTPWSVPLGSKPGGSPVVQQGIVYIGTEANGVFAIDTATRAQRWNRPLAVPVRATAAAGPEVLVVSAGGLVGLKVADGSTAWKRPDIVAADSVSPMRAGDVVYIGGKGPAGFGQALYAVKAATGANAWPAPIPLPAAALSTVAVDGERGLLFVALGQPGTAPSAILALRLADGSAVWPAPVVLADAPAPSGLSLGMATGAGTPQPALFLATGRHVTALHSGTGAVLWSRELPESALGAPPVVSSAQADALLYVGGASGKVYALAAATGADAVGGLPIPKGPISGPLGLAGSTLFVPTSQGLVAAEAATGTLRWISEPGAATGVAVAGGNPYVGTVDGRLVGFSHPPAP
jgi:outer membrane protein assembly factor BamB